MTVLKLVISDSLELVFHLVYAVNIVLHKVTKKGGNVIHFQVLKNTGFSI